MFKKIIPLFLCLCLAVGGVGCSKKTDTLSVDKGDEPSSQTQVVEKEGAVNPLTGLNDVSEEKATDRPVAIMVNNAAVAQSVQTGLTEADVIYETEVEGGITRLMAVYQDISRVKKIGTVRSARYAYIDLAMGHNAIYVHHGQEQTYAAAHLKDTDPVVLDTDYAGGRESNGLKKEHTLYAYGDKLWSEIIESNRTIENKNTATWLNFADQDEEIKLDNTAETVSVPFSSSYKTTFKYDSDSGKYVRYFNGTQRKDYKSGEAVTVKNVFVLLTDISKYSDLPILSKISLESGNGYYFVNGTYTQITWTKGASKNSFVFKTANGEELTVNSGNSWVCIADNDNSNPIIG